MEDDIVVDEGAVEEVEVEQVETEQVETETEEIEEEPAAVEVEPPAPRQVPLKALEDERRKRQELEERLKKVEERAAEPAPRQPQTIEEHFDADPQSVMNWLDTQIAQKRQESDYLEEQRLIDTKINLVARQAIMAERKAQQRTILTQLEMEQEKAVPNFKTRLPELQQTAIEMGLTEADAKALFDPKVVGDAAVRMAKVFDQVNTMLTAKKTLKTKEVKQPTSVEPSGGQVRHIPPEAKKQRQLFDKAKESGSIDDWAAALDG